MAMALCSCLAVFDLRDKETPQPECTDACEEDVMMSLPSGPTGESGPTGMSGPSGPTSATGQVAGTGEPPVLFFTDLLAGPNAGGPNGGGAFVSIIGENFAATRADSTVTIGGVAATVYPVWGENNAVARGLDRIVVQLSSAMIASDTAQDLVVTVAGQSSNALPFTVQGPSNSHIWWVGSSSCDVDTCGDPCVTSAGTEAQPLARPSMLRCKMAAGDIAYIKSGTYDTGQDANSLSLIAMNPTDAPAIQASGTALRPMAILGDPRSSPPVLTAAGMIENGVNNYEAFLKHFTIGNLTLQNLKTGIAMGGNHNRVVNVLFDGTGEDDRGSLSIAFDVAGIAVLGNRFINGGKSSGPPYAQSPAIRIEGNPYGQDTNGSTETVTFAYNEITDQHGAFAMVLPRSVGSDTNLGLTRHLRVFGNRIRVLSGHVGVQLSGAAANTDRLRDALVYDNIISGPSGSTGIVVSDNGDIVIAHNTLVGPALDVRSTSLNKVLLSSNVIVGRQAVAASGAFVGVSNDNLLCDGGACPVWAPLCEASAPSFVGSEDFRLQSGSVGRSGGGDPSRLTPLPADFFGLPRVAPAHLGAVQRAP